MALLTKPFKRHGGKHYLAARIIELMPEHTHYCEPFFGAGSVLFRKQFEGISEVINDLDGELMNFWTVLRDEKLFKKLDRMANMTPYSEDLFNESLEVTTDDPVERAWWYFVRMRMSRQGVGKGYCTIVRGRTRRGMNDNVSSYLGAIEGLPDIHHRIKRVMILNSDAKSVIRRNDGTKTLFYLDPPYLHETRSSVGEYEFEMTTEQHEELLETIVGIKGQFMLSGYHSDLYDKYARQHDWDLVEIEIDNKASAQATKPKMIECIWANFKFGKQTEFALEST